ncbi:MAG: replication-associated recombination protein A, partial [Bradymonadaceae bacterium]
AVIESYGKARQDALEHGNAEVPDKLLNAPTDLHEEMGHGRGYKYPHNFSGNYVSEEYLPEKLRGRRYYEPSENGEEAEIKKRLEKWRRERNDE